jgi:hypothetical protein
LDSNHAQEGNFGITKHNIGTNNAILEFMHLLAFATFKGLTAVLPQNKAFKLSRFVAYFSLKALKKHACLIESAALPQAIQRHGWMTFCKKCTKDGYSMQTLHASTLFYFTSVDRTTFLSEGNHFTFNDRTTFLSIVLKLAFGSPYLPLRSAVERFTKEVLKASPFKYPAIHQRSSMSIIFDLLQHHKYCLLSTPASAAHVCYMLPSYLTAAFAKANVSQAGRKFLASDQRDQKAFNRLTHTGGYYTYDYKEFSKHTQGHLFFDMLMLMRSSLFIGDPSAVITQIHTITDLCLPLSALGF